MYLVIAKQYINMVPNKVRGIYKYASLDEAKEKLQTLHDAIASDLYVDDLLGEEVHGTYGSQIWVADNIAWEFELLEFDPDYEDEEA